MRIDDNTSTQYITTSQSPQQGGLLDGSLSSNEHYLLERRYRRGYHKIISFMEYQLYQGYAIRHFRIGSLPGTTHKDMVSWRSKLFRQIRDEYYQYFEACIIPQIGDETGCLHHHILSASTPKKRLEQAWLSDTWGEISGAPNVWINQVAFPKKRVDLREPARYFCGYLAQRRSGRLQLTLHALPQCSSIDYHRLKVCYGDDMGINQWGHHTFRTNHEVIDAWRCYLASNQPFDTWHRFYNPNDRRQLKWS